MLVSLVGMAESGADEGYGGGTAGFDVRHPGWRQIPPVGDGGAARGVVSLRIYFSLAIP